MELTPVHGPLGFINVFSIGNHPSQPLVSGFFHSFIEVLAVPAVAEMCEGVFFHQVIQFVLHKHTTSPATRLFYEPVCIYMEAQAVWVSGQPENIQSIKLISKKHTQFERL